MNILKNKLITLRSSGVSGLSIIAIIIVLRMLGLLQASEWNALDFALRHRPAETTDERVTLLAITEDDIQTSLSYPLSDQALAELLERIQTYRPRIIGLDVFRDFPVDEGYDALAEVLSTSSNIIGIKKITQPAISAPKALSPDQVGFVDVPLDQDGFLRRSVLGVSDDEGNYQFSFTIRIAERYLAQEGVILTNGQRDPTTMRFGSAEIPKFHSNAGGYVRADAAGNQTLINFRAGPEPFTRVTYGELMAGTVEPSVLEDRVVVVGYRAVSAKDFVNVAAIADVNPGLVPGMDLQAHAVSQVINGALDGRAFLRTLPVWSEYGLLLMAGLGGLSLASSYLKPPTHLLIVGVVSGSLVLAFYGLVVMSWWLPVVPVVLAFVLNAVVLYPMYQVQAQLRSQVQERQQLLDWTFSTIHNGPLQTLARLLKEWPVDHPSPTFEKADLSQLNTEIRDLYDVMRQEMLMPEHQLVLSQQQAINLDIPLSELLYEVYNNTTKRRKDIFESMLHITDFKEMDSSLLTPGQKRELGRFLEEALLNICKYATGVTRLTVICQPDGVENVIRVIDNGASGLPESTTAGYGTRQAQELARKLRGTFRRRALAPKGVQCELRWPIASYSLRSQWTQKLTHLFPQLVRYHQGDTTHDV